MVMRKLVLALTVIAAGSTGALASPDPSSMGPSPNDSATTRYCMRVEPVTGSRVETVECWTRAEWVEQGVDLDKDWPKEGVAVIA